MKNLGLFAIISLTVACGGKQQPEPVKEVEEKVEVKPEPKACLDLGPQTPRDISSVEGTNRMIFTMAPEPAKMNLCNIHTHTNAEHKAPGFNLPAPSGNGFQCADTGALTESELTDPLDGAGAYKDVKPGDTIEVHWVHTSCDITPGPGLASCLSDSCENPVLRVEAQSFLVVNDPTALDFNAFDYTGSKSGSFHQAKALPDGTGTPVVFRGSTTGPKYNDEVCSPAKVTWSVRPNCAKIDIGSLHKWAAANVFEETKSQGVRQLVTNPAFLSPIPQ